MIYQDQLVVTDASGMTLDSRSIGPIAYDWFAFGVIHMAREAANNGHAQYPQEVFNPRLRKPRKPSPDDEDPSQPWQP